MGRDRNFSLQKYYSVVCFFYCWMLYQEISHPNAEYVLLFINRWYRITTTEFYCLRMTSALNHTFARSFEAWWLTWIDSFHSGILCKYSYNFHLLDVKERDCIPLGHFVVYLQIMEFHIKYIHYCYINHKIFYHYSSFAKEFHIKQSCFKFTQACY